MQKQRKIGTDVIKRLKEALAIRSDAELARLCGMSRAGISYLKQAGNLSTTLLQFALERGINLNWLLTGEGEPFTKNQKQSLAVLHKPPSETELIWIPELDVSAGAGTKLGFADENIVDYIPLTKNEVVKLTTQPALLHVITAKGTSMIPTIQPGDKLLVEHIKNSNIHDNEIYIIDYDNFILVKRIIMQKQTIILRSDNPEIQDIEIELNETSQIPFRVIARVLAIIFRPL